MKENGKLFEKSIAKVGYKTAEKSANSVCAWFFHQPETPEKLKKLRKF